MKYIKTLLTLSAIFFFYLMGPAFLPVEADVLYGYSREHVQEIKHAHKLIDEAYKVCETNECVDEYLASH